MRNVLYGIMIGCYVVAGALDARAGEAKLAVIAALFAVANGVIFFWR